MLPLPRLPWIYPILLIACLADQSAKIPANAAGQRENDAHDMEIPSLDVDPDDPKIAGRFSGQVTGPDSKPVQGARLFIVPLAERLDGIVTRQTEAGGLAVRAKTDINGRFKFDAPDMTRTDLDGLPTRRRCLVIAMSNGYGLDWIGTGGRTRSTRMQRPIKGTDLALQLASDDVPIRGRFLDSNGRPLAGACVRLTSLMVPPQRDLDAHLDRESKRSAFNSSASYERHLYLPHVLPGLTLETQTDADGRFTLSGLGHDRLAVLNVSAPSVIDASLLVMTRDAPEVNSQLSIAGKPTQIIHGANFSFQLKRGRTISGMVRDRDSGEPISGMWVGLGRENYPRDGVLWKRTVTDAKGRFKISGLNPSIAKRTITAASAPGLPYLPAAAAVEDDSPVLIECQRGIPFRLKLVDDRGQPVQADVTYNDVQPNSYAPKPFCLPNSRPLSRAAQKPDGTYEGFVVPGPGAVLVKTLDRAGYRPAYVDPKAFFAPNRFPPDRTDWTISERIHEYGTRYLVFTSQGSISQYRYAAIILVNPKPDSGPLELSATVTEATPRFVTLVDPEGKPVVGVQTQGLTHYLYDHEPALRAASFPLTRLHPVRVRRIMFKKENRQLIGFLPARGDGDAPYTVRMQPWAAVTGRIIDVDGKALAVATIAAKGNAVVGYLGSKTDREGRFRIDGLVPGQPYHAQIHRKFGQLSAGTAFEKLVLRAGEVRDLGDIHILPTTIVESGRKPLH